MSDKRVSLAEIAKGLGVSTSTVSRALNNHPAISKEVTAAVKKLAAELNYVPNRMAIGLKSGKRNILGVIIPRISRNFFAVVIEGIEEHAYKNGYDIMICQSNDSENTERRIVATMSGKVDGVMASLSSHIGTHDYFNRLSVPLVMFDRIDRSIKASSVTINDHEGARLAVEHLYEQGYRRIYHFAGPQHSDIWYRRHQGYLDTLRAYGIEPEQSWIYEAPTTEVEGIKFAQKLLNSQEPMPDAIFSSGDYSAIGIISELKKHGIIVPIVGFANESICDYFLPSLTSIDQFGTHMGTMACKTLIDLINGEPAQDTVITPKLIIRDSSIR